MNRFLAGISVAALLAVAPAVAQQSSPATGKSPDATSHDAPKTPDAKSTDVPKSSEAAKSTNPGKSSDMPKSATAANPTGAGWRASNLLNATIRNNANEAVGDINDLIIDPSGKVTSAIVGVGGFLGIGERLVAVSYEQLQFTRDANGRAVVKANLTKESLRSVPEWRDPNATAK